jgi:DNA-binding transcriptional ArsR family regulator
LIRVDLPRTAASWLAFAYSPIIEEIFSLHVITQPKHHPLQHDWVRSARQLPRELRRRINEFSFAYDGYMPNLLSPTGHYASFDSELESLRATDIQQIRGEFLRPFALEFPRDPHVLDSPEVQQVVLRRAADHGPDSERLIRLALDEPESLLDQFVQLLSVFWSEAFEQQWARLEPQLAAVVSDAGHALASQGPHEFLSALSPRLRSDPRASLLWIDKDPDGELTMRPGSQLVLVPSAYIWPHLGVELDESLPSIIYPAPFMTQRAHPNIPPKELLRVLRALADDTRLRALRLIAEHPRSTQELAQLVGISESALSKHLRLMFEAGILTTQRHGYYVLYQLASPRIEALSASISRFLAGPSNLGKRSPRALTSRTRKNI